MRYSHMTQPEHIQPAERTQPEHIVLGCTQRRRQHHHIRRRRRKARRQNLLNQSRKHRPHRYLRYMYQNCIRSRRSKLFGRRVCRRP